MNHQLLATVLGFASLGGAVDRPADEPAPPRSVGFSDILDAATTLQRSLCDGISGLATNVPTQPAPHGVFILEPRPSADAGVTDTDLPHASAGYRWVRPTRQTPPRVVVLLHGLDEPGSIWDDLGPLLVDAGYSPVRIDYPNDQSPARSADLVAQALADLRASGTRQADIVAHSMGGLIARDLLTRDSLYAGDARGGPTFPHIERLITLGTPNAGSGWARVRIVSEARERLARFWNADQKDPLDLFRSSADGDGEAGADLLPGSAFLTQLNARPLPQNVRITAIVGRITSADDLGVTALAATPAVRWLLGDQAAVAAAARIDAWTAALGDGVVPVGSATALPVHDLVVLKANHRQIVRNVAFVTEAKAVIGDSHPTAPPSAVAVILDRLAKPADEDPSKSQIDP